MNHIKMEIEIYLCLLFTILIYTMMIKKLPMLSHTSGKFFIITGLIIIILCLVYIFLNSNAFLINYDKWESLRFLPTQNLPKTILFNRKKDSPSIFLDLEYPVVIKPRIHYQGSSSRLVSKVNGPEEAFDYLEIAAKNNVSLLMIQEYIDAPYEMGILVERSFFDDKQKFVSAVTKIDQNDIRPGCFPRKCMDHTEQIPRPIKTMIESISQNIPGFNTGRYDIRFKNWESFTRGKFYILEVNGSGGRDLRNHILKNIIMGGFLKIYSHLLKRVTWGIIRLSRGKYITWNQFKKIIKMKMKP